MTRRRASPNGSRAEPVGVVPAKRRQRNVPLAAIAVFCMIASVLAFVGVQLASTDRIAVLAVARPVEAGAVITDADLRVAQVAADPALSPIALSEKSSVVGRTASADLPAGSLLVESSIGDPTVVGEGEALVGVEVAAAAAPIGAIRAGDRVQIVDVAPPDGEKASDAPQVITEGRVLRVGSVGAATAAQSQLSLVVPADTAPAVASASAGKRLAVVVIP